MQRATNGRFLRGSNGRVFEGYGIWDDGKGYPCIQIDGKGIRLHVYVWERVHGSKPKGYVVHHRDRDKANWQLENLELISHSDHLKIHAGWQRNGGQWVAKPCNRCGCTLPLTAFYPRRGHTPSSLCKPCTNVVTTAYNKTVPEKRRLYNQRWYAKRKGMMPNATK